MHDRGVPQPPWRVEFYAKKNKSPVLDFINDLPESERAKVRNVLRLLREFGAMLSLPHARPISGRSKLRELRAGDVRLFYFAHTGRRFIILHGFRKKTQKTPPVEIAAAERRMMEFLEIKNEHDSL